MVNEEVVWIGMVDARPREGNDVLKKGALGAYVQILALAHNASTFREKATKALDALGFDAVEFEDLEDFEGRCRGGRLDPEMIRLANDAIDTGECQFATFNSYNAES